MAKTTVRVRTKKWELFNKECKAASIRRDDFLDRALPDELALLKTIAPCDDVGERWLKGNWVLRDRDSDHQLQAVPMLLSDTVISELNAVCAEKKIPRDAFLDCALSYFTARLHEAVIVIRKPRTKADLIARIAETLNNESEELDEKDVEQFILEDARNSVTPWKLERFSENFYSESLSINAARVEFESFIGEISTEASEKASPSASTQTGNSGESK